MLKNDKEMIKSILNYYSAREFLKVSAELADELASEKIDNEIFNKGKELSVLSQLLKDALDNKPYL